MEYQLSTNLNTVLKTFSIVGGKFGDIANIIPILYQEFKSSGQKPKLVIAEKFSSILEGCSYIEPIIWKGEWDDMVGAMAAHKDAIQISTNGKGMVVPKKTPSFVLDQYRLAGQLDNQDKLPLIFDKRDPAREKLLVAKHVKDGEKVILFADHSESSPFEQMPDLMSLLVDNFGTTHKILRLSEVKAEKIYDLIGLYDRADVLVSVETMHLHLSAASGVSVVALVTDKPEIWRGTAWRRQFALHVRYADYEHRKAEIVRSVQGVSEMVEPPEIKITGSKGYNMSVLEVDGKTLAVYRYHPNPVHWRTQLALNYAGRTFKIEPDLKFKEYSIEDGRLFDFKGRIYLCYTVSRTVGNDSRSVIQYGELVEDGGVWRIRNSYQPKYCKNDFSGIEKNWSPFVIGEKLYMAYERSPEQTVIELDGDKAVNIFKTKTPEWSWGTMRGGTQPIPHKGLLLQFFHTLHRNKMSAWWWNYHVGALLMESQPPFQIVSVSKFPILTGNERYFSGWQFWKPRVTIPYGAMKKGNDFFVSGGINDSATFTTLITEKQLNL
jgi:predicted GH43/DUF377 family glycosyl hydrolase